MKPKSILALCGFSTNRQCNLLLATALVAFFGSHSARAVNATWTGTGAATWATEGSWSAAPVPGSALGETATFNTNPAVAKRSISLATGVTIKNITFTAAAVGVFTLGTGAVGSQTLTLEPASAVTVAATAAANQVFNANLVLGTDNGVSSHTFTQNPVTTSLTLAGGITGSSVAGTPGAKSLIFAGGGPINASGAISDGGATSLSLTKNGAGILTVSGANSYTGNTAITGGVLSAASITSLPGYDTAGRFSVASGATLAVGNAITDFDITTILGTGNLLSGSAIGFDTTSGERIYGTTVADSGAVSLGLVKIGANNLTLGGTNTYTGPTIIHGGSLSVSSIGNTGSLTSNLGTNATITMGVLGTGQLTYTGTGETTDRNFTTSNVGNYWAILSHAGTGLLKFTGTFTVTSNNNKTLILDGSTAGTGEFAGVIADRTTGSFITSVTKTGTGFWTLSGANTFTGTLSANGGTLILDKTDIGEIAAAAKLGFGGGTLRILGKTSGATTQTVASIALNAGGLSTLAILPNGGDSTTLTITAPAPTATAAGSSLVFDTSAGTPSTAVIAWSPTLTGGIIGANFLMKDSTGMGFATATAGNVTRFVPGTVLDAANPTSDTTDFVTNTTGTITNTVAAALLNSLTVDTTAGNNVWDLGVGNTAILTTGGIFMSGANDFTIQNGTLASSSASPSRLVLNQFGAGVLTINSTVTDGVGASTLNKLGTGTVILGGNNTFTGATNLQAGTLKAGSAAAFNNTGQLSMASSATFDLNGNNAAFTNIPNSTTANTITNTGAADATLGISAATTQIAALLTDGPANKLAITLTNNNSGTNLFKLDSPNTFSGGITLTGGNTRLRAFAGNIASIGAPGAIISSPFGTGPIRLGSAAVGITDKGGLMFDTLSGTNTVLNEIIFNTELGSDNKGVRVESTASNLTLAGDITASLADAAFSGSGDFTISGSIKGSFGLEIGGVDNTTRTVTLTAASNPYLGDTTILKGVLSVSSIANQLGTATTPIAMGAGGAELGTARLRYTGTGETTSRGVITSGVLGNNATIEQAGDGLLKFTGNFTVATGNNRHLILDGSTAGTGEIAGVISDSSATLFTQVSKNGTGTWTLSGQNTYSRNTFVNAGTLILADNARLKFITSATSGTGNNQINGAGNVVLDGDFDIDTSATDASALTSGTWQIENVTSLTGAYPATFTVVGWNNEGNDTWTKTVGSKKYIFDETTGTVTMSGDPYAAWIDGYFTGISDPAIIGPDADPDNDGVKNLIEYALNGKPNDGSSLGLQTTVIGDSSTPPDTRDLTLVIAVLDGTTFTQADGAQTATIHNVTYTVQGSADLTTFSNPVSQIGTASDTTPGLPDLTGTAWEYKTFKLDASEGLSGKGFLRLLATAP